VTQAGLNGCFLLKRCKTGIKGTKRGIPNSETGITNLEQKRPKPALNQEVREEGELFAHRYPLFFMGE